MVFQVVMARAINDFFPIAVSNSGAARIPLALLLVCVSLNFE